MPGLTNRLTHGNELFRRRRMDADGAVEDRLGRTGLERYAYALNNLARLGTHHVHTQDTIGFGIHDHLHQRALVAAAQCMFESPEFGPEHLDLRVTLPCL